MTRINIAHLPISRQGRHWLVAEPTGARIQALGSLDVSAHSSSPVVDARAPRSETPTLATVKGDAARLTRRRPPDLALLRQSVASYSTPTGRSSSLRVARVLGTFPADRGFVAAVRKNLL